jgi:hypothetical protein
LVAPWYASMMYWFPLMARMGKQPMSSVNKVAVGTIHTCSSLVGAVMKLKSAVDGSMWFSEAGWPGSRKMAARAMERADFVDRRPCWTWVMCLIMVGVAFSGQYHDMFATVR